MSLLFHAYIRYTTFGFFPSTSRLLHSYHCILFTRPNLSNWIYTSLRLHMNTSHYGFPSTYMSPTPLLSHRPFHSNVHSKLTHYTILSLFTHLHVMHSCLLVYPIHFFVVIHVLCLLILFLYSFIYSLVYDFVFLPFHCISRPFIRHDLLLVTVLIPLLYSAHSFDLIHVSAFSLYPHPFLSFLLPNRFRIQSSLLHQGYVILALYISLSDVTQK